MFLGHVGRFAHQKNHSFLIDVFAELIKLNQNSILVLVGDGPLRIEIEKKVKDLKLEDKVKFLGIRSDIDRFFKHLMYLFFHPLHEGLPVSLIEAQGVRITLYDIGYIFRKKWILGMNLVEFLPLTDKEAWIEKMKK